LPYKFYVVLYAFVSHRSTIKVGYLADLTSCRFSNSLGCILFTQVSYMSLFCFIQATDLAGLLHLVKFYKSRRFDADIGMPRSRSARA
jgi:hypothetical protein